MGEMGERGACAWFEVAERVEVSTESAPGRGEPLGGLEGRVCGEKDS